MRRRWFLAVTGIAVFTIGAGCPALPSDTVEIGDETAGYGVAGYGYGSYGGSVGTTSGP